MVDTRDMAKYGSLISAVGIVLLIVVVLLMAVIGGAL